MKPLTLGALVALGLPVVAIPTFDTPTASATALMTPWTSPTVPARCTDSQIKSGSITDCVIRGRGARGDVGFGYPPDPLATGMRFNGWSYDGPPVDEWQREFITANHHTVAGFAPGRIRTHIAAAALFEGFLAEISAGGYSVKSATGYTFRCTSGSGGNCTSGSMSHHTWGLAIDINPGANPNRTYYRDGLTSACAIPMVTDLPKWTIDAAQRWGLYWGGYGWSSGGCPSPTSESDSIRRDAHHFEFNGTVAEALTIAKNNGADPRLMACFAIVTPQGNDGAGCNLTGLPSARWRTPIPVSPPAGAAAAIVNVTVTGARDSGYVTVEPCSRNTAETRTTSNNNYSPGRATANSAFVPVTASTKQVCVWRATPAHTVVDIVGFVAATDKTPSAKLFQPVPAERLWDTRSDGTCTSAGVCTPTSPTDHGTVAYPLDESAVVNVTVTRATSAGYATAARCADVEGALSTSTSTVNYLAGEARANVTFASATDGHGCVYAHASTHVIVDMAGRLVNAPASGAYGITPIAASRILDTRNVCGQSICPRIAPGAVHRIPNALANNLGVVNVTVTNPAAAGFVTVGDCAVLAPGVVPSTSTVNYTPGATVANLAYVVTSTADLCVWASSDTHVVIDLQAEMSTSSKLGIQIADRYRAADTRNR